MGPILQSLNPDLLVFDLAFKGTITLVAAMIGFGVRAIYKNLSELSESIRANREAVISLLKDYESLRKDQVSDRRMAEKIDEDLERLSKVVEGLRLNCISMHPELRSALRRLNGD